MSLWEVLFVDACTFVAIGASSIWAFAHIVISFGPEELEKLAYPYLLYKDEIFILLARFLQAAPANTQLFVYISELQQLVGMLNFRNNPNVLQQLQAIHLGLEHLIGNELPAFNLNQDLYLRDLEAYLEFVKTSINNKYMDFLQAPIEKSLK